MPLFFGSSVIISGPRPIDANGPTQIMPLALIYLWRSKDMLIILYDGQFIQVSSMGKLWNWLKPVMTVYYSRPRTLNWAGFTLWVICYPYPNIIFFLLSALILKVSLLILVFTPTTRVHGPRNGNKLAPNNGSRQNFAIDADKNKIQIKALLGVWRIYICILRQRRQKWPL